MGKMCLKLLLILFLSATASTFIYDTSAGHQKKGRVCIAFQDTLALNKVKKEEAAELCKPMSVNESSTAQVAYMINCHACHGVDRMGASGPSLYNLNNRVSFKEFKAIIETGRAQMPGFRLLDSKTKIALYKYLSALPIKDAYGRQVRCDTIFKP